MYRFSQIIALYKILKSQKTRKPVENVHGVIISDLTEVSSEELCLPQANLDLKRGNSTLKGPVSKSNVMFQDRLIQENL